MSAAITAAHAAAARPLGFPQLEQQVKEGKLTLSAFQKKMANLESVNAGQGATGTAPSPASVVGETAAQHKKLVEEATLKPGAPGSLAGGVVEAAQGPAGKIGQEAVEGAISFLKPDAQKLTLYLVFIVGSVALVVYGVSKMLEPVGGPNLKDHVKGAVKKAGEAAVFA
jgi:hypothetical protein